MDIPINEFNEILQDRRERGPAGPKDFNFLIGADSRETCSKTYFPYTTQITRALLSDKHVMFIGDSLVRAMYKDMVSLIRTGEICQPNDLRVSNEDNYHEDKHIDFIELEANRVFRQAREFQSNRHLIQYFFTSRSMREDLEKTCLMMEETNEKPDVLVVNSAIWDISRYPSKLYPDFKETDAAISEDVGVAEEYFNRVAMFCRRMRCILPPSSTFIWLLMPPSGSPDVQTGFISHNHVTFDCIRMRQLEANVRIAQIVREAGFDVLDLSFHMRSSNFKAFRIKDGVHWNVMATRFMNQLLLGHLTHAWRLDTSVRSKWPQRIIEKLTQRTEFFDEALNFLKDRNKEKFSNEDVNQELRLLTFEKFKLDEKISMEKFHHDLRTLLMFFKYCESTEQNASINSIAFTSMPVELSRFTQEDIQEINKIIKQIIGQQRNDRPNIRIAQGLRPNIRTGARKTLLALPQAPTAPVVPPGLTGNPHRIADAVSPNLTGNSHRIAAAVPLSRKPKKRRHSESRQH